MHVATRPGVKTVDSVLVEMRKFPGLDRLDRRTLVDNIVEASTGARRTLTELEQTTAAIKREAKTDKGLREKNDALRAAIRGEDAPEVVGLAKPKAKGTPAIESLRSERKGLEKIVARQALEGEKAAKALAREHVTAGIKTRNELVDAVHKDMLDLDPATTRSQVEDWISGYGKAGELSTDPVDVTLRLIRGELLKVGQLRDLDAGQPPKKTGTPRGELSDEARAMGKQVREKQKEKGLLVTDPARQLKSAMDAAKTRVGNSIKDLADQIIKREKTVKDRKSLEPDAELARMKEIQKELRAMYEKTFGKEGLTDAERLERALKAVEKSEAEYRRRMAEQDYSRRPASKTPNSYELEQAKWRRDAIAKAYRAANRNPPEVVAARKRLAELEAIEASGGTLPASQPRPDTRSATLKAVHDLIAAVEQRIKTSEPGVWAKRLETLKRLEQKLIDADTTPPAPKKEPYTPLSKRIDRKDYEIRQKRKELAAKVRPAPMGAKQYFAKVVQGIQSWAGQIDQAGLRQGIVFSMGHPLRGIRMLYEGTRAGFSKARTERMAKELEARDDRPFMERAGMQFEGEHGKHNEFFLNDRINKLPTVAWSERSFVTGLNYAKISLWDGLKGWIAGKSGRELSMPEAELIANAANIATGKGHGKSIMFAADGAVNTLWSAGLQKSRIKWLTGQPLWTQLLKRGTDGRISANLLPKARAAIFVELYARPAIGVIAVSALLNALGYDIEWDSRSSDFGKARKGNTRTDLTGGMGQYAVFATRMATGQTKDLAGGKIKKMDRDAAMWRFLRNKLNPVYAAAASAISGKNTVGDKRGVTSLEGIGGLAYDLFLPPTTRDVVEIARDQGLPVGLVTELLMLNGGGTQVFNARKKKVQ